MLPGLAFRCSETVTMLTFGTKILTNDIGYTRAFRTRPFRRTRTQTEVRISDSDSDRART
jgi:hypothetical protein